MEPICPICRKTFEEGCDYVVPMYVRFYDDAGTQSPGQQYHEECFQGVYIRWVDSGEGPTPPEDPDAQFLALETRKVEALEKIAEAVDRPEITVGGVSYRGPLSTWEAPTDD